MRAFREHAQARSDLCCEPHVAEPIDALAAAAALRHGPRGALVLATISVGLLFIGWLVFYFSPVHAARIRWLTLSEIR